jgi:hypothetical protein
MYGGYINSLESTKRDYRCQQAYCGTRKALPTMFVDTGIGKIAADKKENREMKKINGFK